MRLWLAQRHRFHVHYTSTYSSWLNQVERWFGLITQQAIRRGSFRSVRDLITRIQHFVDLLQPQLPPLHLDRYRRLHPPETLQSMLSYFWDSTLGLLLWLIHQGGPCLPDA